MSQALSNLAPGAMIKIQETVAGVSRDIQFRVLAHGHHAAGATTLVRNQVWVPNLPFNDTNLFIYKDSAVDNWCQNEYLSYFSKAVEAAIVSVPITTALSGDSPFDYADISRKAFLLSRAELGFGVGAFAVEGTLIPYFNANARRVANKDGTATATFWWTRTTRTVVAPAGSNSSESNPQNVTYSSYRPAFCLPSTLEVSDTPDGDGCYIPIFPEPETGGIRVKVGGEYASAAGIRLKQGGIWRPGEERVKDGGEWLQ